MCEFGKLGDISVNIIVVYVQFIKFYGGMVGFIYVSLGLNKLFFKVIINGVGWS